MLGIALAFEERSGGGATNNRRCTTRTSAASTCQCDRVADAPTLANATEQVAMVTGRGHGTFGVSTTGVSPNGITSLLRTTASRRYHDGMASRRPTSRGAEECSAAPIVARPCAPRARGRISQNLGQSRSISGQSANISWLCVSLTQG